MNEEKNGEEKGHTRELGERGAHEMFVRGSGGEVKGGEKWFKVESQKLKSWEREKITPGVGRGKRPSKTKARGRRVRERKSAR